MTLNEASLEALAVRLRPHLGKAWDHSEAERLKEHFAQTREVRQPFYLTRDDLEGVFLWKLGPQEGRQRGLREGITEHIAETVTGAVFAIDGTSDTHVRVQIGLLCALPGVGVPVASAIMAVAEPHRFGVVDRLNWPVLYGVERDSFSIPQYLMYLRDLSALAEVMGCSVQDADEAIWAYASQGASPIP